MSTRLQQIVIVLTVLLVTGCGRTQPSSPGIAPNKNQPAPSAWTGGQSDLDKVRSADISILFVGNSHTMSHDIPGLICNMIRFRHPEKTVYSHAIGVGHLSALPNDPRYKEEIETRPWKFVVLQGQNVSQSGQNEYSRTEAIDVAKLAKERGAKVYFYAEWGLKDVAGNGPRTEKIYTEMARAAGVHVAPVDRAWNIALAARPDMPLHDFDGNHQSAKGAFLTACFLFGRLTGESPAPLAAFPFAQASANERKFLAETAAKALAADE